MTARHELPPGWLRTTLGEVIDYGKTEKIEPDEISDDAWVLELEDIEKDSSRILQRVTFAERKSRSTKNCFKRGDVLYGKLRPYLNKVVIADAPGFCTTEIVPLRPNPSVDSRYLFYWLKHPTFLEYVTGVSHGLNMPRLGTEAGKNAPFALAPLAEQKRIADKLDRLLAAVDTCKTRLDAIPAILKRFRQSVLATATSGELTEEWRRAAGIDGEWKTSVIAEVASKVGSGATPRGGESTYKAKGVPLIRSMNVVFFGFKRAGLAFIDETQANDLRNVAVAAGDVLLNITGASIGRVTIAPVDLTGARVNQHVCIIRPISQLRSDFLCWFLASPKMQKMIGAENYGVTRQALTKQQILEFEVPVPAVAEQEEIASRVRVLFDLADQAEENARNARSHLEELAPCLLSKAFAGELIPQNPNDAPISIEFRSGGHAAPRAAVSRRGMRHRLASVPKEKSSMSKNRQDQDVKGHAYLASHLRALNGVAPVEELFKLADLPVADFYKQLAWEVDRKFIRDAGATLEAADAP